MPSGPEAGLTPLKGKGEGGRAEQEQASITAKIEGRLSKTNGGLHEDITCQSPAACRWGPAVTSPPGFVPGWKQPWRNAVSMNITED